MIEFLLQNILIKENFFIERNSCTVIYCILKVAKYSIGDLYFPCSFKGCFIKFEIFSFFEKIKKKFLFDKKKHFKPSL